MKNPGKVELLQVITHQEKVLRKEMLTKFRATLKIDLAPRLVRVSVSTAFKFKPED